MIDAALVEVRTLSRQWQGKGGVVDVSLKVPRGAFVSILGPSGCGKSTLLRLLAGLERPDAGSIRIGGREVTHLSASQRGLSMVFQSYALFPHLSVQENILFGLKVRRVPRAERAVKLAEAAQMLGLEEFLRRKPAELSGGQRQRVALARAVVSGHRLCLMDEPLSNLDAKLRNAVRRDIRSLQKRLGLTVVYVTHDQVEAMSLSDEIVLMRAGRVEQSGTPLDLYERPATPFAAEFVGDPPMALIDGPLFGHPAGSQVGIRTERIVVLEAGAGTPDLVATVADAEFLGAETRVLLQHDQARGLAITLPGQADWSPGRSIGLQLPDRYRVLFPAGGRGDGEVPAVLPGGPHRSAVPQ